MKQSPDKLHIFLICTGLVLATIIAYEPVRQNEFLDYDDDTYVVKNEHVNSGISLIVIRLYQVWEVSKSWSEV